MDPWVEDQLIGSWEDAYESGDDPGCIMSFYDLMQGRREVSSPSYSKPKPRNPKKKKLTKKEQEQNKIIDLLEPSKVTILSTPMSKTKDPILKMFEEKDRPTDNWFLEWLGVKPMKQQQAYEDQWFIDWLGEK